MKILITEDQLKSVAIPFFVDNKDEEKLNKLKELRENWSKLNVEEKKIVLELYKILYPEKVSQLNEGVMDWVQSGLDIAGIFDPTGISDLTNAVLYFGRGEVLFGMLSLVAIIPYVGDAIAKPVMLAAKAGAKEVKLFSTALKTKNAIKIAETTKTIKGSSVGNKILKFLESFSDGQLGRKIMGLLESGKKIPIVGKFFRLIEEWVGILTKASKEIKVPTKSIKGELKTSAGVWKGTLKGSERVSWGDVLKQMFSGKKLTTFRELSKAGKLPYDSVTNIYKNIMRVPESRKLMGKTKMFLRFLDHLGLGNYIGPEELEKTIPNAEQKFAEFVNTPEGQEAMKEEFATLTDTETYNNQTISTEPSTQKNTSNLDLSSIASKLGINNITPDVENVLSQFLKTAI